MAQKITPLDLSQFGGNSSELDLSQFQDAPPKPSGAMRRMIGDKAVGFASGAVGATKAIVDAAGAGGAASKAMASLNDGVNDYLSPEAKADQQEQSAIMSEAKGKGAWEGVKAGAKAFAVAPVQTAIQGVGSIAPIIAGSMLAPAAVPAMATGAAIGTAMGAGTAKGAIYDDIKQRNLEAGKTEAQAHEAATQAQEYGGGNTDQIALGGALGAADALTGAAGAANRMIRSAAGKPVAAALIDSAGHGAIRRTGMGMLAEMPLEAAQGGQEQVAANVAAQRAGFDAGTWDNVASNATLEALASAGPGAAFGFMEGGGAKAAPAANEKAPLQLGMKPDPLLQFKGGTVARQSEIDTHMGTLDENGKAAFQAKIMGLAPQPANPIPAAPVPVATPSQQAGIDPNAGVVSKVAAIAMDSGVSQSLQPEPEVIAPTISLEESDAIDQSAYDQFFENHDQNPVVGRYFENDSDIPDFGAESNVSEEDFLRALGATDEEIQDAIATTSKSASPQSSPEFNAGTQANEPAGATEFTQPTEAEQEQVTPPALTSITQAATNNVATTTEGETSNGTQTNQAQQAEAQRQETPIEGVSAEQDVGAKPTSSGADFIKALDAKIDTAHAAANNAPAPVSQTAQPAMGEGAGVSQPTQDAATQSSATPPPEAGYTPNVTPNVTPNPKAIERIAKGTAYFGNALKAGKFIHDNGLSDSHEVKKTGASKFEIVVKAVPTAEESSIAAPMSPKADSETPPKPANAIRTARIKATLDSGGRVVDGELRSNNGMGLMKLTPDELATIPTNRVTTSQGVKGAGDAVYGKTAETPAPVATEVDGLKVYPITHKGEPKWASQNPDNVGTSKVFGDTIHATQEEAIGEAKASIVLANHRSELAKQAATREAEAAAKKEANKGMTLADHRANAILDKPTMLHPNAGLGTGTRRESMQKAVDQGRLVTTVMEYDPAGKKRDQDHMQRGRNLPTGNENYPGVKEYREAAARLKADKYEKPSYRVYDGKDKNGSFREISKTEHDYAQDLKEKPTPTVTKPAQPAIENVANTGNKVDVQQSLRDSVSTDGLTNEQVDQIAAMFDKPKAATPAKSAALIEQEKAAKAKMLNAAAKLATLLSKNTRANLTEEQEQAMLPIVIELFEGAMQLGYVKFRQAARYVREYVGNIIDQEAADAIPIDTLQAAYIATARRHGDKAITPKTEVVTIDSIAALEEPAESADTETQGENNDTIRNAADNGQPLADPLSLGSDSNGAGAADEAVEGLRQPDPENDGRLEDDRSGRGNRLDGVPEPVLPSTPTEVRPLADGPVGRTEERPNLLTGDSAGNFTITDEFGLGTGTDGEKINANLEALRTLRKIQADGRFATPEEQATMARYVGWGGIKTVFDPKKANATDRYGKAQAELKSLLNADEYRAANDSIRNAHYTAEGIVDGMWRMARFMGLNGGRVLEPTAGIGNFLGRQPADMRASTEWHASELDIVTGQMAALIYPEANILAGTGFQEAPFADGAFDFSIGNPPFGAQPITDKTAGRKHLDGMKIHNYIIAKTGMHLRPGGVMSMVVTHRFLDTPNPEARAVLAKDFRFLGAFRLPNNAFKANAGTDVVTDVVFLQKLRPDEARERDASWLNINGEIDVDGEKIRVNKYYQDNPAHILGRSAMDGTLYAAGRAGNVEYTVHGDGRDIGDAIDGLMKTGFAHMEGVLKKTGSDTSH